MRKGGFPYMEYGLSAKSKNFYMMPGTSADEANRYLIKFKIAKSLSGDLTKNLTGAMRSLARSVVASMAKAGEPPYGCGK